MCVLFFVAFIAEFVEIIQIIFKKNSTIIWHRNCSKVFSDIKSSPISINDDLTSSLTLLVGNQAIMINYATHYTIIKRQTL